MFKTIATAALTAIVVVLLSGLVGGNSQPGVGGDTRFPNSTVTAKALTISNGSATTTVTTGKVCFVNTTNTGATLYSYYSATGNLATSTASCL